MKFYSVTIELLIGMAGNISKYFYEAEKIKSCADFHHSGFTCLQSAIMCCKSGLVGSGGRSDRVRVAENYASIMMGL